VSTVDSIIGWARRWSPLALVSIIPLWGMFVWQTGRTLIKNDFQTNKSLIGADHLAFYTGARLTWLGPQDKLYEYKHFVPEYQRKLFWHNPDKPEDDTWRWLEAYRNPPHYAMLYWPLCERSYFVSSWCWFFLSFVLIYCGVVLVTDERRGRTFLWVLSFLPCFMAFDYGQNSPISFALFAAVYRCLKHNRPFAAGLIAGLLLFKPQLLLGLAVWALLDVRTKWPCAVGVVVSGLLQFGISYPLMPVAWEGFFKTFESNREFESFDMFKMHNPLAFIRLAFPAEDLATHWFPATPHATAVQWVRHGHNLFAIACGIAAVLVFVRLWWYRRQDLPVMFGGVVFLTLWAGPHALIYEWLLLALTGILWFRAWGCRPNTWFVLYGVAWGVLYCSTDLADMTLDHKLTVNALAGVNAAVQLSVPVLAGVGLFMVHLLSKGTRTVPTA
jgi:alpha-1,2-mannosyltransferase